MVRPSFTAQEIPNANMCVLAIFPTLFLCINAPAQPENHDSPLAGVVTQIAELLLRTGAV